MDYNYIRLENQIKSLMNKNYSSNSGVSQIAQQLQSGNFQLYIDTVTKQFIFKYHSINNPIGIEPINNKIINVKYINDVDVSKLIGGISAGDGIDVEDIGNGIFKVSVKAGSFATPEELNKVNDRFNNYTTTEELENKYATKDEMKQVDDRFDDYTTTTDIQATYVTIDEKNQLVANVEAMFATKDEVKEVVSRFNDYTSTTDLEATYATKDEVKEVDERFNDYTSTTDLEATYLKKDDYLPTDIQFTQDNGYPYFTVKNSHISIINNHSFSQSEGMSESFDNHTYNILMINMPDDIKNKILINSKPNGNINVFKIILRKNIIYDSQGNLIKEFICYINNLSIFSPVITLNVNSSKIGIANIEHLNVSLTKEPSSRDEVNSSNTFFIAFDTGFDFNPYTLYMNGELSIMYLLSQDALVSLKPVIRCDVIEAKNALTLHETDVYYMYKPSIITEETLEYSYKTVDTSTSTTITKTDLIDCFKMIYKLPPAEEYEIPQQLNFKFIEYCFGNEWSLIWNGDEWLGENVKGRSNGVIKCSNLYMRVDKKYNDYGMSGCWVRCKHDEWNAKFLDNGTSTENYMKNLFSSGLAKTNLLMKDDTLENGRIHRIEIDIYKNIDPYSDNGYDYLPLYLRIDNHNKNEVNSLLNRVDKICLDMTINNTLNRLTFRHDTLHEDQQFGYLIDLIPELDSVEKVNIYWGTRINITNTTNTNSRDIVLYLRKDYTDPIDEVNYDPTTNAFDYIIKQQFYEITPNPNGASTLYTDYNITSSKIITADNITTMRSDLNMVANTVDVVSYDLRDVKSNVETLNSEMAEQMSKTKYLEKEVDKIDMKANIGIALGAAGCVLGATGIGVAGKSLAFSKDAIGQVKQLSGTVANIERDLYGVGEGYVNSYGEKILDDISSGTGKILGDGSNLPRLMTTRSITTDLQPILVWCDEEYKEFNKIPHTEDIDDPDQLAMTLTATLDVCNRFRSSLKPTFKHIVNRINEMTEEIESFDTTEQVNDKLKEYVSKDDLTRMDVIDVVCSSSTRFIRLTAEDTITNGELRVKIFIAGKDPQTVSISYVDGKVEKYKGIDNETEAFRNIYLNSITVNDNITVIEKTESIQIAGAVIESNTCIREMRYTVNDIAYVQDIEALDRKINTLAEQSHANDVSMISLQETFPTVDEVNEVLSNYVQIKDMPPVVDTLISSKCDEMKTKIATLEEENATLKAQIEAISSQLNQLMNDVYTKNESDEKYLNKNNVINELNYSRTDIETLGELNTSFTFTNIEAGDLKDGFVFSFYNTSITTEPPPIISHKYLFEYEMNEQYYVYISEDKSIRLFIYILPRTDNMNHFIYLRDINNGYTQISKYVKYEWYLESGYKFDSSYVYCKEIVDAILSPSLQE